MRIDSCSSRRMSLRLCLLLPAALLSACATSWDPPPRLPPNPNPNPQPVTPQTLVQRCRAVAPRVHPWRARQIRSAILRYDLSRAYRRGGSGLAAQDLERAQAEEREAWGILWETCQPVLAGPATATGG